MKTYKVVLSRGYVVSIDAKDRNQAARAAELYVGNCDDSTEKERAEHEFSIKDVEMTVNDALEVMEEVN